MAELPLLPAMSDQSILTGSEVFDYSSALKNLFESAKYIRQQDDGQPGIGWYDNIQNDFASFISKGAHIFSVSARTHEKVDDLWYWLSHFWPNKMVEEWKSALNKESNRTLNILPLEPTAHTSLTEIIAV